MSAFRPGSAPAAVRVIKIGGRAQADPALLGALAAAWHAAPRSLVVVHGGGDEVSRLQRMAGVEPVFVGGRRVTSEGDLELLRMALSGSANKRLVSALVGAGIPAVGVSGEDDGLLEARADDPALGHAGHPTAVHGALLALLLGARRLPVVSPIGRDAADGGAINVNGDDAAAAIAGALGATELLLVADVPGVLDGGVALHRLTTADVPALVARGVAAGGMAAKLESAAAAIAAGVGRVRIGDVHAILDATKGTTIVAGTARTALSSRAAHAPQAAPAA